MAKGSENKKHVTPLEAAQAYAKTLEMQNAKKFSAVQPDDVIHDPTCGMAVSRQGKDRGAIVRDCEVGVIFDPHTGNKSEVLRVSSGLVRMLRDGVITEDMAQVGGYFMAHFAIAGYTHYASVNLLGNGGGSGCGIEEHIERTAKSREIVDKYMACVGYPSTAMSKAVFWMLGHGVGMENMAKNKALHGVNGASDKRYWRAVLVSALELMAIQFNNIGVGSGMKGQRGFNASDLVINERQI